MENLIQFFAIFNSCIIDIAQSLSGTSTQPFLELLFRMFGILGFPWIATFYWTVYTNHGCLTSATDFSCLMGGKDEIQFDSWPFTLSWICVGHAALHVKSLFAALMWLYRLSQFPPITQIQHVLTVTINFIVFIAS